MESGECVYDDCELPYEGTKPDCHKCEVSGTSGYPTCNCNGTQSPPTGTPLSCTTTTYCCNDANALNKDPNCPDAANNKVEDNSGTCTYCTSSSTDPKCEVPYCPDTDPGGNACKKANPDMNCKSDESSCKYYYCNDSTNRPNNYDAGGNECKQNHQSPRQCIGGSSYCKYDPVDYCDVSNRHPITNEEPSNGQTKSQCEEWNEKHTCIDDSDVCSYPNSRVEISYCPEAGFTNSDVGGISCESSKPADATCVASPSTCSGCLTCEPHPYCNVPGFMNYSDGAVCSEFHGLCQGDIGQCEGTASCNVGFDVDITCDSGFTFTGTFDYVYDYDNTEQCVEPTEEELTAIANYLEAKVCDMPPPPPPCLDPNDPLCKVDWCSDIVGVQTDPDDCAIDVCPDMDGVQTTEAECQDTGLCSEGYYYKEDDGCTPIDICPNLGENQAVMPTNYNFNSSGDCVNSGGDQFSASCNDAMAGHYFTSDDAINSSNACSTGIFGNYVAFDISTNPDSYNWSCYGSGGATANCRAYKGIVPLCGTATSTTYKMDQILSSSMPNLCAPGNATTPVLTITNNTTSSGGVGVINWSCGITGGVSSVSCVANATGCSVGSWCPFSQSCELTCEPPLIILETKLKTSELIKKNETCLVSIGESINGENSSTLCTLKNITTNRNVDDYVDFTPSGDHATYTTPPLSQDTVFRLTCGQDTFTEPDTEGNNILDASEADVPIEGSCRLNLNSEEFN